MLLLLKCWTLLKEHRTRLILACIYKIHPRQPPLWLWQNLTWKSPSTWRWRRGNQISKRSLSCTARFADHSTILLLCLLSRETRQSCIYSLQCRRIHMVGPRGLITVNSRLLILKNCNRYSHSYSMLEYMHYNAKLSPINAKSRDFKTCILLLLKHLRFVQNQKNMEA